MINGAHAIVYSTNAEADRAVLRDVFGLPHVDVGGGWLIFGLPPAEVAVHPSDENDRHELYLMCADVQQLVEQLTARGLGCGPVQDHGWGVMTAVTLPGGGQIGVYQPRHARPESVPVTDPVQPARRARSLSLYTELLEAWNRRNADDFAACFADGANVVGFDGSSMDGRTAIALELRTIFADHKTASYVAKVREIRDLGAGVTLLRAAVGMVPAGQTELNPAVNAVQSLVLATDASRIEISLLQNTPAAFHGRPQDADALTVELTEVLRSGRVVA
jgi:uncharacterized protein (TIGR02246 family)